MLFTVCVGNQCRKTKQKTVWKESGFLFCKSLCKLFLPTDILTSTYSKAGRPTVKVPYCFLSQFGAFVPLWSVSSWESWKEHSHMDQAALLLPPSLHQRGFTIDRLSDCFVSIIFLCVDQFHCFHSSPMSTGHFSKPCSFSFPPRLSYAYFHFILELSYFCFCRKSLHLLAGIRIAWGWRFSKETIWQVFSLNVVHVTH